ncbi:hypothetical protein ACWEWI_25690 [Streptomyces sp. NPDC003753]
MSAVAAKAAVETPVPASLQARPRLLPVQAGPVPARGPGRPLALGRDARARLGGAVRALLEVAGLEGEVDAVRLAAVVLAARTPEATGQVEIRASELGRWLGMSKSYVASVVLPRLRRSGVVRTDVVKGEFGEDRAVACEVVPLLEARGVVGHPLALSRKELATLLRLLEAVMAPGWVHRDGRVTPAGLLGTRTGRGAATDRLALLLLVLEANQTGRVRLCGGSVDTKRGRAAVTVARLLGCSASGGERVLERLEAGGLVKRPRRETASGMAHRSRLVVPAVAAAHRAVGAPSGSEDRGFASKPGFSDPDAAAVGSEPSASSAEAQVSGVQKAARAGIGEPDVTAALHTDHSSVADEVGESADGGGFSGEPPSGCCGRPECACAREDGTAAGTAVAGRLTLVSGSGSPLRGDKREESATNEHQDQGQGQGEDGGQEQPGQDAAAVLLAAVGSGSSRQRQGRVPRPPRDLETVFAVVEPLWARLERSGARAKVVEVARQELAAVAWVTGEQVAGRVLAHRLQRRLAEQQGGPAGVTDPVGWLIGRGLPRRADCGDPRCDEGMRMDTGGPCETCGYLVADRRSLRRQVAVKVDAALPHATAEERRVAYEQQLRAAVREQLAHDQARRERAALERERRQEAVARARAEAEAAEQARLAQPCSGCGKPDAAGWCQACANRSAAEDLIIEAALTAAAAWADLNDRADVDAVLAHVESTIRTELDQALADAAAQGAMDETLALLARLTVENTAAAYQSSALSALARSEPAETEARLAYEAQMRASAHRYATRAAAKEAAVEVAQQARERAARHLLSTRTAAVRARQFAAAVPAAPVAAAVTSAAGADSKPDPYAAGAARVRAAMRSRARAQAI